MGRVFVIQGDPRKNMLPAEEYGEIVTIFDAPAQIIPGGLSLSNVCSVLRGSLKDFDFDEDYIMLNGDPLIIGLTTRYLLDKLDRPSNALLKVLKWDRQEKRYYVVYAY